MFSDTDSICSSDSEYSVTPAPVYTPDTPRTELELKVRNDDGTTTTTTLITLEEVEVFKSMYPLLYRSYEYLASDKAKYLLDAYNTLSAIYPVSEMKSKSIDKQYDLIWKAVAKIEESLQEGESISDKYDDMEDPTEIKNWDTKMANIERLTTEFMDILVTSPELITGLINEITLWIPEPGVPKKGSIKEERVDYIISVIYTFLSRYTVLVFDHYSRLSAFELSTTLKSFSDRPVARQLLSTYGLDAADAVSDPRILVPDRLGWKELAAAVSAVDLSSYRVRAETQDRESDVVKLCQLFDGIILAGKLDGLDFGNGEREENENHGEDGEIVLVSDLYKLENGLVGREVSNIATYLQLRSFMTAAALEEIKGESWVMRALGNINFVLSSFLPIHRNDLADESEE